MRKIKEKTVIRDYFHNQRRINGDSKGHFRIMAIHQHVASGNRQEMTRIGRRKKEELRVERSKSKTHIYE